METPAQKPAQAPAPKKAPAVCVVGASGAGKTYQIMTLAKAAKAAGLELTVACFDSGSLQSYECGEGYRLLQDEELDHITDLCDRFPADKYLLVVDTWRAYEEFCVARAKAGKKAMTLRDWQIVSSAWMDDLVRIYQRKNAVLVAQVTSGPTVFETVDLDGKPIKEKLPAGQVVCAPSLKKEGAKLVQSAPVVLPLSSGGNTGVRSWASTLGSVSMKYIRRAPSGGVTATLPGSQDGDRTVPVSVCSLGDIWTSLLR